MVVRGCLALHHSSRSQRKSTNTYTTKFTKKSSSAELLVPSHATHFPECSTFGGRRRIHHLSYGEQSLNECIPDELGYVQFTHFDEFLNMVRTAGQNCWLWKRDVKSAYRHLPIRWSDWELFGFALGEHLFFDPFMGFGGKPFPASYERMADSLEYVAKVFFLIALLLHYMDDSVGANSTRAGAVTDAARFEMAMAVLGYLNNAKKRKGPTQQLAILGILVDTVAWEVRVTPERLKEAR